MYVHALEREIQMTEKMRRIKNRGPSRRTESKCQISESNLLFLVY